MRRAISLALTGALIVSMGVAAFAVEGIPSKTVQDIINVEVTAPSDQEQTKFDYKATTAKTETSSASQTTAASSSASSSTASSSSTAEAESKEVEDVLGNIMKNMDTVISVGQKTGTTATTDTASSTAASSSSSTSTSASTNRKVNPLASTSVTITTNNMKDEESGIIELKSAQTEAVQAATEVYAVAAVPVIDPATGEQKVENGEPVFRYVHVPAVIRNGKVQAVFTNAILKQIGTNNFVLTAFIVTETSTQAASK